MVNQIEQRAEGFRKRIKSEKDIEPVLITGMDYIDLVKKELSKIRVKTALFCSGDIYALTIMKYLHEWGITAPADIGIMGFDNIHILEFMLPALTTISNAVELAAINAVDMLIKLMNDEETEKQIILDHGIIAGSTV